MDVSCCKCYKSEGVSATADDPALEGSAFEDVVDMMGNRVARR